MKKFFRGISILGIFFIMFFIFKNFYKTYNIEIQDKNLAYNLKYKGIINANDFTFDENGNFYIAYMDRIQYIDKNGKSYDLIKDKSLNINSIEYNNKKLYFFSKDKVFCYDLDKKEKKILVDNLPNYGDYKDSIIKINGNEIFVSIGAATNSGVVGTDNVWIKENPFYCDISPKDITIKGRSFGNEKTGAFVPYKTKNQTGQIISGHFPGNASIIHYDLNNGYGETFAWGIRNVTGMDFNSEGKLIAAVGGMEDRGLRPVKGDVDYIYEIKKGLWYGWPDYSGGDPLTSPRFKGKNNTKINFILDNHPNTNPPAPIYQHKQLSSIKCLTIDSKGLIGEKDSIYFYDKTDNIIYKFLKSGNLQPIVNFKTNSNISSLKIFNNNILALDKNQGVLYEIYLNNINKNFIKLNKNVIYYLLTVITITIFILIWKFIKISKKKQ
ncbi:Glucose / Sorbosone dehydrogenase [Clostridium sp. USBA 49]|uniref:PQQ-dependent sugar dehydrogenase n=1 Tax=Clostridium TaxID=1485 RepID=UPI000998F789|nr:MULTISPECIES: PQQ-dependent sugar dehydrogenase [Clostridium]SKA72857.1 Glucose / Sorbosone dehydrogenase [Clostridium sp. USBA 49]